VRRKRCVPVCTVPTIGLVLIGGKQDRTGQDYPAMCPFGCILQD
jgi:Lon protease-like protein